MSTAQVEVKDSTTERELSNSDDSRMLSGSSILGKREKSKPRRVHRNAQVYMRRLERRIHGVGGRRQAFDNSGAVGPAAIARSHEQSKLLAVLGRT